MVALEMQQTEDASEFEDDWLDELNENADNGRFPLPEHLAWHAQDEADARVAERMGKGGTTIEARKLPVETYYRYLNSRTATITAMPAILRYEQEKAQRIAEEDKERNGNLRGR